MFISQNIVRQTSTMIPGKKNYTHMFVYGSIKIFLKTRYEILSHGRRKL